MRTIIYQDEYFWPQRTRKSISAAAIEVVLSIHVRRVQITQDVGSDMSVGLNC